MSLTSHLDDPNSPVRQFLNQQFPTTRTFVQNRKRELFKVETIRLAGDPKPWIYAMLGTAIDYRLRYFFPTTPVRNLVAWKGAIHLGDGAGLLHPDDPPEFLSLPAELVHSFFSSLEDTLAWLCPAARRLDRSEEELLARYCVVLALFDQVFRAGPFPGSPLFLNGPKTTLPELLAVAEDHWVDDLCSLSWLFYDRCKELLSCDAILNPTFMGSRDVGGADADLIVDGCLIDIKTTISGNHLKDWLYQLLGYVLLDYDDRYGIRDVGIYFSRQGTFLRWPLRDLMFRLCGVAVPPLAELRQRFQDALRRGH